MKNTMVWGIFGCMLAIGTWQAIHTVDEKELFSKLYQAQAQVLIQPHLATKDANLSPILDQFATIKSVISQIDASLSNQVTQLQGWAQDLVNALHQANQIQLTKIKDTLMNFSKSLNKVTNSSARSILEYIAATLEAIATKAIEETQGASTPEAAAAETARQAIIDILNILHASSIEEAIANLKEIEQELEKRAQNIENYWRIMYASLAKVLGSSLIQSQLDKTTLFTQSALKQLSEGIISAIFEGKIQLFEALTVLKKNATPLVALLIELQKAKAAGKPLEEIVARIPNTIPDAFKLEQLSKEQVRAAVNAIAIEPLVSNKSATAANKLTTAPTSNTALPSKTKVINPIDMQHLPELLELLEANNVQQAREHANLLIKKIQEGNNAFDKSIRIVYQSFANVLNSSVIKKELAQITSFTQAAMQRINDLLVNAIFELKKQLLDAQMIIEKHANPLILKLIELQKAKQAGKTAQEISALIPTEIPDAPSIGKLTEEQLKQAVNAIKLEPYEQKK